MNKKELYQFVGNRIREERKKRKLTQKQLGEKIGVKHNTISSWESGVNAPEQNAIFQIAEALNIKVDDLFPNKKTEENYLDRINALTDSDLDVKDMYFLQQLIEKTLSLDEEEREKFIESIKFTVEFYEKQRNN
ncbi:transcriptional regulator with XRE-family HTH domain [Salirhabdus euzebyi]|uniref:Transcriptional regulator with XRE-family HTH domain n=1 Tax=Salirhabdus euzebyi TaxID=394506 RepID=A0A841PT94_9BACI|nr:helix-turn-helix transcriptional regulator [Salirhabdus euzebyi]MBB6452020.1 transcriptional regulator with XRE-family HTH domain [Salirhabdus euzebyi]